MTKFLELLEKSIIAQYTITAALVITTCYMVATGQDVPDLLSSSLMLVLGYYFGTSAQRAITAATRNIRS